MLTISRRGFRLQAAWALALVLGAPAFVQAQQTGLFPLAPIRRERVPCPSEDPVYGLYRQQYFGYFPTCWHRFPPGWGCPSAEAPNAAQSFKELPMKPPEEAPAAPGEEPPGAMENEPLPAERAPAPKPSNLPPLPRGERSPFDLDTKPENGTGGNPPAIRPPAVRPQPGPRSASPEAGEPRSDNTESPAAPPVASRPEPREAPSSEGAGEPLLALPEPGAPGASTPAPTPTPAPVTTPLPSESVPNAVPDGNGPSAAAPPAQTPQRRSLIRGLLSGLGLGRR